MLGLLMRNIASVGWILQDGAYRLSKPGCVIASSSYPLGAPGSVQDYVHNWTRDAAIVAFELAENNRVTAFEDYVSFARLTQEATLRGGWPLDWACFHIDASPRESWTAQGDGPALQTLAILHGWALLSGAIKPLAASLIDRNLQFLLEHHRSKSTNLWEETFGHSLFTRSVQLRCFEQALANGKILDLGREMLERISVARKHLCGCLDEHFVEQEGRYRSVPDAPGAHGWDLNSDVIMASVYGALPCTDERLLSTAAQVYAAFADASSPWYYEINGVDAAIGLGPMIGRYPLDTYDGRMAESNAVGGHPWAPCTCNFAELYYNLARMHRSGVPLVGGRAAPFYAQAGIGRHTPPAAAADLLKEAGDRMLRAIMHHSDHVELSEQFHGKTGFQLSIRNLTWSYASFMSAVRARNAGRCP